MPSTAEKNIQIENKNALLELLVSGAPIQKILIAANAFRDPKTKKIVAEAHSRGVPIERVARKRISRVARTSNFESIIGFKPAPKEIPLDEILETGRAKKGPLFFLVLDHIHYVQNLGALMRTAFGSGVDAVIIPKRKDAYLTEDVTRISMGASERVPIIQTNLFDALKKLQDAGVKIIGVHMDGKPYYEADMSGDVSLVLGSEDTGISTRILPRCDMTVKIPMQEGLDSLNVAAAGAVIMFEKIRQDKMGKRK